MAALVTLAQAKTHLRITTDDHNTDVYAKALQASGIVIRYLKSRADPTWDDATVPENVRIAILLALEDLHEHKPIDWQVLERLLVSFRDPALA